jgi:rubrerythrin
MNPFNEKPRSIEKTIQNWQQLYPKPYNKREVDPYTKTRIILMNGTEFESNWFSHQFARHVDDNDLRRDLALTRYIEKQQQLKISLLKPCNESILEHTISYEQLAVDLTAELAKRELDCNVKTALDFALLEDFDHLYRYANLLEMEQGIAAEWLVGRYTEIMPGRPTISHHRYPMDNVKRNIDSKNSDVQTVLNTMIITAAEQQTMNYYMNVTNFASSDMGRKLYQEIALVEEEHVTQYESLMDSNATWLEMLLWHEYCECYLYWSCYMTETDPYVKALWEENLSIEITHLHKAAELLKKYEHKDWCEVIKDGEFPAPISLHENIDYVRKILGETVQYTSDRETYIRVKDLPKDADFFRFQNTINPTTNIVPSHCVIENFICRRGADYRYQVSPSPVPELRNRREDNTSVGRKPNAADYDDFFCNK